MSDLGIRAWGVRSTLAALAAVCMCVGAAQQGGSEFPTRKMPEALGNTATGATIKIGLVASRTGDLKPWGVDTVRGAQIAVDEFNASGGLKGKKVELIVEDEASRPEAGRSAAEKLVSKDKVLAVIGGVSSGIAIQVARVCQEGGVPYVIAGATREDLTQIGSAIFRCCYSDNFQAAAMAMFARTELKLENVGIMTDRKLPFSVGLSTAFAQAFVKLGGHIAREEFYEFGGDGDYRVQLKSMKASKVDGLFCSGYFTEVGPMARQRAEIGLNVPMLGGDGWDSDRLVEGGGKAIVGGYFANHCANDEARPEMQRFVKAYRARTGREPDTVMAALGYDAALVVLDALKRTSALNSLALMKAIARTKNLMCATGPITIGEDGNAQKPIVVMRVQKGKFIPVKRIEYFDFRGHDK